MPELGNQIAPYFAVVQIIFLLLFVAYFILGVVSLAVDFEAMDCECAEDSWIWLYALLVIVIPTSMGMMFAWAGGGRGGGGDCEWGVGTRGLGRERSRGPWAVWAGWGDAHCNCVRAGKAIWE